MRSLVVGLVLATLVTAAAAETPVAIPGDPEAQYFVLWRTGSRNDEPGLVTRRVGPNGVGYAERTFDCQTRTLRYFLEADSLKALRRGKSDRRAVPIVEGSVDHYLWIEACVAGLTPEEARRARIWAAMEMRRRIEDRMNLTRPRRREGPLRSANVSDREVGEIKLAALEVMPGAIVNIGGIVSGCPCEDGPSCTDQVWIVAYRREKSQGLQLSRINRHWTVGPVQRWWIDKENLEARRAALGWKAYYAAEDALTDKFPACIDRREGTGVAPATRTSP